MGSMLTATCGACGFETGSMLLGGGMSSFKRFCGAPALCQDCGAFEVLNYLERSPRCQRCGGRVVFYNDASLQVAGDGTGVPASAVFSWNLGGRHGIFLLPDTSYLCPQCRDMTLRFSLAGFWD